MTLILQQTELYKRLNNPNNLAFEYLNDERLQRDVWNIRQDLPPLAEDAHIKTRKTIRFDSISLLWLRELTKLATLIAVGNRRWGLSRLLSTLSQTNDFDAWLINQGYISPSALSAQVVQHWGQNKSCGQKNGLYALLWVIHQFGCIHFRPQWGKQPLYPKHPKTISEEVKEKLDIALKDLDRPVYLAFKLHAALGTRSIEIAKIPLDCLRLREGVYRVRIPTGKQDSSEQEQDLPDELVPLVQEQQAFVRQKFGEDFPWLFPNWKWSNDFCKRFWPPRLDYSKEQLKGVTKKLNDLLKQLIKQHDIRTSEGNLAHVTLHMFRRTWATVASRMGKRPDQIMHGLRHLNLDMQDSYVKVSPQEQEKRTQRVLVDKTGKHTIYRTDCDSEFLRKEWQARQVELGVCTRPSIMKGCEFEYVCLGCEYVRFAAEHLPQLVQVRDENQQLLEHCIESGQSDSRRAHSTRKFIAILIPIIASLQIEVNQDLA